MREQQARLRRRVEAYWERHVHELTDRERADKWLDELTHAVTLKTDAGAIKYLRSKRWADPVSNATIFRRAFRRPVGSGRRS